METPENVRPGDRVVTSGDGSVLPAGLLVGQVQLAADQRMRLRLSADYERLEFLRVLRSRPVERIGTPGKLVGPPAPPVPSPDLAARGEAADG